LKRSATLERVAPVLVALVAVGLLLVWRASRSEVGVADLLLVLGVGGLAGSAVALAFAARARRRLERIARSARLLAAGDDRDTARRFLAVIDRHSERLGRLTDDLLTLSDLELGRTPLRLAPMDLEPAVEDVTQILVERAARSDVQLTADVDPATPPVLADGDRLRQVLINLIDNAIKFTPAGGRVTVRAAAAAQAGAVEIAVEDSGIGIPAQDLSRLTERFFRVDKARSRALGGTGLGLAIVKHLIQAHGGTLDITSTIGHGTTVLVRLPAAAVPARASGNEP
jgi:two-component system phosphate regulon sensor histidine kinase PhoR